MSIATDTLENPFPGLRPFREDEAYMFFGRESQIDAMVNKLAATRFLAVIGTSGSGKSSLVNCGLRPALHLGLMARAGTAWRMAQFRPGSNPLQAMARALAEEDVLFHGYEAGSVTLAEIIETTLRMSKLGLIDIYEQAHLDTEVKLLLVVDQFEELFRYRQLGTAQHAHVSGSSEDATAFVNLLLEAGKQVDCPIYVVLTMRSDFLGDCAQFPGLAEAINTGQYLIPRLTRDERRAAISGPIGVAEGEIAPVLLTRLVNDVGDNPDQLSILQHALNRTWAHWQHEGGGREPLALTHYEAIGTMAQALDRHAEKAYAELGTARQQHICEKLFKALTDKATDPRGVRRPTILGMLCVLAGASAAEVTEVIEVFRQPSRSFVMPPAGEPLKAETVIDISHESLMRVWQRLKAWADEEAQSARLYRRLAETAALHQAGKANLWRDPELQLALDWRQKEQPTATWAARYHDGFEPAIGFLEASEALRDQEVRQTEARRQETEDQRQRTLEREHALQQARALSQAQTQAARRLRWLCSIAAALAIIAGGAATVAIMQSHRASIQSHRATLGRLAFQAITMLDSDLDLALLLSVEATRTTAPMPEAQNSLVAALAHSPYLLKLLPGHTAPVLSVAFSPDGSRLASASFDGTVRRWNPQTGQPLGEPLQVSTAPVLSVAFSPDGSRLASASFDQTIRLWDVHTGQALGGLLQGHTEAVTSVAFSPDGSRLASASFDQTVRLWDVRTGQALGGLLQGHTEAVTSVAFSPDGSRLASASGDKSIRLWDARTGQALGGPLQGHTETVTSVAFSPDGSRLASASGDKSIRLWDARTGQALEGLLQGHTEAVTSVAFSPDGSSLASTSSDQTIRLWNPQTGQPLGEPLQVSTAPVLSVAFSPDGSRLASASGDQTVRLWDAQMRQQALGDSLQISTTIVTGVAFSPDGSYLASASGDQTVRLWDAQTGQPLGDPLQGHTEAVTSVAFSPDGSRLASGSDDGTARLWDVHTRQPLGDPLQGHTEAVTSVAFSPDGSRLASGSDDGTARLWDVHTGQPLVKLPHGHMALVTSVAFSPDGSRLASASSDQTVRLWDAQTGQPLGNPLQGHTKAVWSAAFSPDGSRLASTSSDQTIRLWDVHTRQPLRDPLQGHTNAVTSVAFSPDGSRLASGSDDGTARLWDVHTGQLLVKLPHGHMAPVTSVAFSPDGSRLASASNEGIVHLWDVDVKAWRTSACRIANRNLTQNEWEKYIDGPYPYHRTCPDLPAGKGVQ